MKKEIAKSWTAMMSKATKEHKPTQAFPFQYIPENVKSVKGTGYSCCSKTENIKYTGTNMLGVSAMHKSNLVPVFNTESVKDISKMRRG